MGFVGYLGVYWLFDYLLVVFGVCLVVFVLCLLYSLFAVMWLCFSGFKLGLGCFGFRVGLFVWWLCCLGGWVVDYFDVLRVEFVCWFCLGLLFYSLTKCYAVFVGCCLCMVGWFVLFLFGFVFGVVGWWFCFVVIGWVVCWLGVWLLLSGLFFMLLHGCCGYFVGLIVWVVVWLCLFLWALLLGCWVWF